MASVPNDRARDAHYHPVRSTAKWAELMAALAAVTVDPPAVRERKLAQRKRETTYSRRTEGGH